MHGLQFGSSHHLLLLDEFPRYLQVLDLTCDQYHGLAMHGNQVNIVDNFAFPELHFQVLFEAQSDPRIVLDVFNDFRFSYFRVSQNKTQQESHVISQC